MRRRVPCKILCDDSLKGYVDSQEFAAEIVAALNECESRKGGKPHYLPSVAFTHLCMACQVIDDSVKGFGCFLVGSALKRADYRDVDVRCVLQPEEYDRLFESGPDGSRDALFGMMCLTISSWLSERTGLPVDFQFQRFNDCKTLTRTRGATPSSGATRRAFMPGSTRVTSPSSG